MDRKLVTAAVSASPKAIELVITAFADVLNVINSDPDIQEVGGKPLETAVRNACKALHIYYPTWIKSNFSGPGLDLPTWPDTNPNVT